MKRTFFRILPMIGIAAAAMFAIDAHAAAAHVAGGFATLLPDFTAEGVTKALAAAGALGMAGSTVATHVEKYATTKWFAIATEGATVDGRTISRAWIEQMAANYNPQMYGARVNMEHIKGIVPDGPFKAYGDVLALKAEEVGGKMKLFAQISPTPALVAMNKDRQKIYTSAEVNTSFADTKQAYLIGLAVTDSPASLGTDALHFSARNTSNLFTAAIETSFELEEPTVTVADQVKKVFSTVATILGKKDANDAERFTDLNKAIELLATHGKEQSETVAKLSADLAKAQADYAELKAAHDKTSTDFAALQTKLSNTQADPARPHVTGQSNSVQTDC
jgi:hypothetical protein